ncbi:MAG: hypothetical protein MI974_19290 [Chitinophagales bacterium]|nr:hypothetical protein [Chitinophagales bacterium]
MYRLLTEGKITTEEGLMDALFDKGPHQRGNFNRMKRQLEEKLVNTLFLSDNSSNKPANIQEAHDKCFKNLAVVKLLLSKHARNSAIIIAERTFQLAEKYKFTFALLSLAKHLRTHYASMIGNSAKFSYYDKKIKHYKEVFVAELEVEGYYSDLVRHLSTSNIQTTNYHNKASYYIHAMKKIIDDYSSYRFKLYGYNVISICYEIIKDSNKNIAICNEAISFFKNKKHAKSNLALRIFYFRKIPSLMMLKRFQEAEQNAKNSLELDKIGHHNWYRTQKLRLHIALHTLNYQKTYDIYLETIQQPNFHLQYPNIQESWKISEAYIYYLFLRKKVKNVSNKEILNFRINRFLNEIPTFSKDKQGLNISILILHTLLLLHQKQYDKIIDRTEALRTYTHRYLRQDETFRSNCFIKMLMQLPKANFHRAAVERKTKELREKLSSVGIIQNQSAEVEIVPYEMLWEFVLESLDNKIH